jgi:hypothetical protein
VSDVFLYDWLNDKVVALEATKRQAHHSRDGTSDSQ